MSDEDDYMSEESYEFEFEEDEDEEEIASNEAPEDSNYGMENNYYNAKCLKSDDLNGALLGLRQVFDSNRNEENINWIFKACKQLIKINVQEHRYDTAIEYLQELMLIIPKVNPNYAEESVSRILNNSESINDPSFVSKVYDILLKFLNDNTESENENGSGTNMSDKGSRRRLWLKINVHKLNILIDNKDWIKCKELISVINMNLQTASESMKNAYSLEVIAAEIIVNTQGNTIDISKLHHLYKRSMKISTAVTHPKIMGIIRECGAKVQFYRGNYEGARLELYESFKNYDEAGSSIKKKILKYLALCSLLTENQFNPFESQETQTYVSLPEYQHLIQLVKQYDENNLKGFKDTLRLMEIEEDPLVQDDIFIHSSNKIMRHLQLNILGNLLKSYRAVNLDFLAKKLDFELHDLEDMLLEAISGGKLPNVSIDLVLNCIEAKPLGQRSLSQEIFSTVDATDVLDNMKCSDALGDLSEGSSEHEGSNDISEKREFSSLWSNKFNQDYMMPNSAQEPGSTDQSSVIPTTGKQSTLNKFVFQPDLPGSELHMIDSWMKILSSGVPVAATEELSQKDQVKLEQRVGITSNVTLQQSSTTTNGPIIQTTLQEDKEGSSRNIDKISDMRNWCKQIQSLATPTN
ncbi:hypothetical protein CAAN3_04S04852 [[Candida] anglica]